MAWNVMSSFLAVACKRPRRSGVLDSYDIPA